MTLRSWIIGWAVVLLLALVACGGGGAPSGKTGSGAGDPEAGKQVYVNVGGCGACHTIEGVQGANGLVGPDHTHIATIAAQVASEAGASSAEEYIRQSILDPNAYVTEDCPTGPCVVGIMPNTFKDTLTEQQLNDVVAFLMQQK